MTVERGHRAWQVHPGGHLDADVLAADLATVAAGGGGPVFVWVTSPTATDDAVAAAAGLASGRDLYELRVPLPTPDPSLDVRPFRPGDEAEWVEVNNRAFSWHPEQGGWTVEMLRARLAEPWVDLDGFLVHEREGRMAGYCWTKVHADHDPPLGEIYVIAVDPDFHGLGLGRALTLAGLHWLHHERGLDVGMLYVDASNTAAVTLYGKLGFVRHSIDRAYAGDV